MLTQKQLEEITLAVVQELQGQGVRPIRPTEDRAVPPPDPPRPTVSHSEAGDTPSSGNDPLDITSQEARRRPLLDHPRDPEALQRMMGTTSARIGVGRAGPRLKTQTLLTLRADHAAARDAVLMDVPEDFLDQLGLFSVQTKCTDKDEFLTRPDLGRQLSEEAVRELQRRCVQHPDIQIYASDGLSSTAVQANLANLLPILTEGLQAKGFTLGTSFFVKYGRVGVMDQISELLDATVTCVLLGERPGLGSAESMSAYLAYRATVGMPEARRTVVSNIHRNGIAAVEAGAYLCDVIEQIYHAKASGVDLRK